MLTFAKRSQGIALVAALGLMAVGSAVMLLLFMRTMDEIQHGRDDTAIVQTLLVAHGGARLGVALLQADVKNELDVIVGQESDPVGAWSFGDSHIDAEAPTPASVASDLRRVADRLQSRIDAFVCGEHSLGDSTVLTLRIHVTETACGQPLPRDTRLGDGHFVSGKRRELGGSQTYALPFVMVADGYIGEFRRRVVTQGQYQFVVGRQSFARYALFTDVHQSAGAGGRIWFTSDTLFDGPVHTNGNFNFYGRPWFGGYVSSAGVNNEGRQGAVAYDGSSDGSFRTADQLEPGGNSPNMDAGNNPRFTNRPQFTGGVDWRSEDLPLPDNAFNQRQLAGENGILITQCIRDLQIFAADANGNPVAPGEPSVYQYVRAEVRNSSSNCSSNSNWSTVTWRISESGRLERLQTGPINSWHVETESFNGLIYADDYVERLRGAGRVNSNDPMSARPALAAFSQITIVPARGARITSDLVYEDQPCEGHLHRDGNGNVVRAECPNQNAKNVLGIFAPSGDVLIGNATGNNDFNAPRDVRIQASLMTSQGIVAVENFREGNPRGAVQLLGGIIEREYGAFGTFNPADGSPSSGYNRQFTFDPRLGRGLTPPYFPTIDLDGAKQTFTFTFGHREQVF